MPIKLIIGAVTGFMALLKWLRRKWDARILAIILDENVICTLDFICRAVPGRSRNEISKSLSRLVASGDIYRAGIGYASRTVHAAITVTMPGWSS
jgi:predicted transcriptional regulator